MQAKKKSFENNKGAFPNFIKKNLLIFYLRGNNCNFPFAFPSNKWVKIKRWEKF